MVEKIKPLKMGEVGDGEPMTDTSPTEADPTADYTAIKGVAFENSDDYRIEKIYRAIIDAYPDASVKVTYTSNNPTLIEYFTTATQITANRIASNTIAYSSNNPSTETFVLYQTDGTTIVRTITRTYTYTANNLQTYIEATT